MIGPVVSFWNIPGESRVQMYGCENPEVAAFAASLARVLRPPGPQSPRDSALPIAEGLGHTTGRTPTSLAEACP